MGSAADQFKELMGRIENHPISPLDPEWADLDAFWHEMLVAERYDVQLALERARHKKAGQP